MLCCLANKFVHPNDSAASLCLRATQPWKLELGVVIFSSSFVFVYTAFVFVYPYNAQDTFTLMLTREPRYFPGACPQQLSSPSFSSSQQETFIQGQAADIVIFFFVLFWFFLGLVGWLVAELPL